MKAAQANAQIPRARWLPSVGVAGELFEATTNNTTNSYAGVPEVDLPRIGATTAVDRGAWSPAISTLAAISVGQELFDFGKIAAQSAAGDAAVQSEHYRAEAERLGIDLVVKESYFGVQGAKAVFRAAVDAYERTRVHRDMAEAGVKSGLFAPIERTRAEADLARFEVSRLRAQGGVMSAEVVLAAAVGTPERMLDSNDELTPAPPLPSLDQSIASGQTRDPLLLQGRARVSTQQAVTRAIAAELRPNLLLSGTFSGRAGGAAPSNSGKAAIYGGWLPDVTNWDVGLVLRWPLYDGVAAARQRASATQERVLQSELDAISQQELAAIQQAYVSTVVARAALDSLQRALDAARANYAQAEARFKNGLGTSLELADAEYLRTDAEITAGGWPVRIVQGPRCAWKADRGGIMKGATSTLSEETAATPPAQRRRRRVPMIIGAGVAAVLILGLLMVARASSRINKVALVSAPTGVTAVEASAGNFSPFHRYVGTLLPWVGAKIGPQLISAYVGSVLVRPGDHVKRGQIIGTLDCRNASAVSQAISMQAQSIQTQQQALAHEAARIAELQNGGFASDNEIEKKQADSASKQADLLATRAKLERATLEVNDCVLRAPFDGEVSDRTMDPGAYVHPGQSIATVVDRTTVRICADVPEEDFDLVRSGVKVNIHALANGQNLVGLVSRRSPAADESTRTVHFEVDIPDPKRTLPVGTTAEITVAAGAPMPATEIPLAAGEIKGGKATLFVVDHEVSRKIVIDVLGEKGGTLFVDKSLPAGSLVITEGRALLREGDRVQAKVEPIAKNERPASPKAKGGVE